MDINLKDYYFNKFLIYGIKKDCFKSLKKHKDSIKEYISKIVDDHNENIFTESFIDYLTTKDLYRNLADIATNDKYLLYELISSYYQELIKINDFEQIENLTYIKPSTINEYLDFKTRDVIEKVISLFTDMCRMQDMNIYYYALMRLTVLYMLTYCHLNSCMDKYDDLIGYYKDDMYKMKDEMIIYGIDIADSNRDLIDIVSRGLINRNKRMIK